MSSPLAFKDPQRLISEWMNCEPKLHEVIYWMLDNAWPEGISALITSIWRSLEENKAAGAQTLIHCQTPHRAADFSIHNITTDSSHAVVKAVNEKWRYDPERPDLPVAYIHDAGSGQHLHLQVHERTEPII